MGLLVKGEWSTDWYDTDSSGGEFIRTDAQFRNSIGDENYPAEAGRYHLFVSLACPWAHRTLIFRKLKKLEDIIGVTTVVPEMLEHGWVLSDEESLAHGYEACPIEGIKYMYEVYTTCQSDYSGRVTVPTLWDKKTNTIVSNESSEIIRMLNTAFNELTGDDKDYYPQDLRQEIDEVNELVYHNINNGVYKCGFATKQDVYEKHYHNLFEAMDKVEEILGRQRYLAGSQLTEADWRLFTTLIRFDPVYYGHFKTNKRRIEDYPNISNYVRELYQVPGVSDTVSFRHIKVHYYYSHDMINPTQVVPAGPDIDYNRPHNREELGKQG
ncbi:MAG: glutathione-dependent reductase [Gammaproteobacteria bacterium]|nr:glutathione-dependent reductase [Gammaproteobacteria bacterium]|tara:strand:- start:79575 stop:80549 length:975 start_codon:yes stop_codon:yes gene_type:complete